MSTRRIQFFMRQQEFNRIIEHWCNNLSLCLIVIKNKFIVDDPISHVYDPRIDLYLAEMDHQLPVDSEDIIPAKLGWIEIDSPREENNILFKSVLGTKTTWYDPSARTECRNDEVLNLFKKASKPLRKQLQFPIWAKNEVHETAWQQYRDIGYSLGAEEWIKRGGELRQRGVKNIIYSVKPTAIITEI